jgi:M6 family metalloprotease-like protein
VFLAIFAGLASVSLIFNGAPLGGAYASVGGLPPSTANVLCILVEFPDLLHSVDTADIRDAMEAMGDYWRDVSYGALDLSFSFTEWLQVSQSITYYGTDLGLWTDILIGDFIAESITLADPYVDFAIVDHIMIVHAGAGQEVLTFLTDEPIFEVHDRLWSCAATNLTLTTADGRVIERVAIVPEMEKTLERDYIENHPWGWLQLDEVAEFGVLGAYAHEFGHLLGLPDLYDENQLWVEDTRVGRWGLMAEGAHLNYLQRPCHPLAWSKVTLGWVTPQTVIPQANTEIVTLAPLEAHWTNSVVILPISDAAYYLVEYRQKVGYDDQLPDEGVLITQVNNSTLDRPWVSVVDNNASSSTRDDAVFHRADQLSVAGLSVLILEETLSQCLIAVSSLPFRDLDGDELADLFEDHVGTNPESRDTDADGLDDRFEIFQSGTSPTLGDSDGDGVGDGQELDAGTSPFEVDTDGDLWQDGIDWFPTDSNQPTWLLVLVSALLCPLPAALAARRLWGEALETRWEALRYRGLGVLIIAIGVLAGYGGALMLGLSAGIALWLVLGLSVLLAIVFGANLLVHGSPRVRRAGRCASDNCGQPVVKVLKTRDGLLIGLCEEHYQEWLTQDRENPEELGD